jgi:hypothetical protein
MSAATASAVDRAVARTTSHEVRTALRTLRSVMAALRSPSGPDAVVVLARTVPFLEAHELVRIAVLGTAPGTGPGCSPGATDGLPSEE